MNNQVEFVKRKSFGSERLYPRCHNALDICELTRTVSFNRKNISRLQALGFDVIISGRKDDIEIFEAGKE